MTRHIQIESLSKHYRIGAVQRDMMLRERLMEFVKRPFGGREDESGSLWALRDVSFEVNAGEVVGIIGRNGAGKSTLLKILSKITYPTSGSVRVNGRVAALLEVGTGFHDELTGRENIYLNGSILGMRKREVDERFDAIVDFSGVAQFIDTPVKRYSSGMRLRLGFAVAAHLDPDVLVVDEVLAVGDAAFQKKCIKAMEGLHSGGRTVLFVSHNMAAVENLCSRGIWIDGGKIQMDGAAKDVIDRYMATSVGDQAGGAELLGGDSRLGNGEIRYTRVEYLSLDGTPCGIIRSGDPMVLRLYYHAKAAIRHPSFGFRLYTQLGTLITETGNVIYGIDIPKLAPGNGYIDVVIESLNLLPARYTLSLWITEVGGLPVYDGDARIVLDVEASDVYGSGHLPESWQGIVYFPQRWRLSETQ